MANWFIGIPVAPGAWFDRVTEPPRGVARAHPDDLHLTIAFLGSIRAGAAEAAFDALAWDLPAREVVLGAVVPMGARRRPSAFSALLDTGRAEVEAAMERARGACFAAAGARPDERPPKAHVTVARPERTATEVERRGGEAWARAIDLGAPRVALDRAALFTWSEDRSRGPRFRVARERPLAR
jgi:2'-5' RNA ligase